MVYAFPSSAMPSFCLRWWLDCDPAAFWRLGELWPQLEGLQEWFWWPALRVLAGQRTHTWPEHPGRLQPPHRPGGLEQQAQTCPLPKFQVGVKHECTDSCCNTCTTSCISSLLFPVYAFVCSLEDEHHQYRLHVSGFSGTAQDSFSWYHDKQGFSTPDSGNICAEISHGGWWYNQCFYANLNGVYYRVSVHREPLTLKLKVMRVFITS